MALINNLEALVKLEGRICEVERLLEEEARRHADSQKNLKVCERRLKELAFQRDEDKKNKEKMQEVVEELQQKVKTYEHQLEEAEGIAALNLAKFRQAELGLEEAQERAERAEKYTSYSSL